MEINLYNEIVNKCKTKADGVYSYKKHFYLVYERNLRCYSDYFGNVFEVAFGFNVSRGKCNDRFESRDLLKKYLKQFKS